MPLASITLKGTMVTLVPMLRSHLDDLCAVGLDPDLWSMTTIRVASPSEMYDYIEDALRAETAGSALPFVMLLGRQVVGTTRLHSFVPNHRRVEIGFTWVGTPWHGTGVNTEAKYLLLRHAFETIGCERVAFTVDAENERSCTALRNIGATEEALLRHYMISPHRGPRDVRVFSMILPEWPAIRVGLERRIASAHDQLSYRWQRRRK